MIELEQIKQTDPIKSLRGQLNTAFGEIVADQCLVAKCANISAELKFGSTLKASVTASKVTNTVNALVFPENNGVYIARLFGRCLLNVSGLDVSGIDINNITIDIPAIQIARPNADNMATINTFVPPSHLGLNYAINGTELHTHQIALITHGSNAAPIFTSGVMKTYSDNANALDFYMPFATTTFTNGVYYITF